MALLTDQIFATGVSLNDLIHIVVTGDTSQNPAGSSFKASMAQVVSLVTGTTGTSGTSGSSGTSGTNGTSGTDGTSGSSGSSGTDGSSGTNGTSGSSGTSPVSPLPYVYGLFSQTGNTGIISGTTEQSIIGTGVGTLTVGANQFQIGDSFTATFRGVLSNANNFLQFRVKSGSVILADSTSIQYNTQGDEVLYALDLYFTIIRTGGAGTASITTRGFLRSVKNSNYSVNGYSFNSVNNTTFDTTISNTLDVTMEFDTSDPSTYIETDFLVLNKTY